MTQSVTICHFAKVLLPSDELHHAHEPFKSEPQSLCTSPLQALANSEPHDGPVSLTEAVEGVAAEQRKGAVSEGVDIKGKSQLQLTFL